MHMGHLILASRNYKLQFTCTYMIHLHVKFLSFLGIFCEKSLYVGSGFQIQIDRRYLVMT